MMRRWMIGLLCLCMVFMTACRKEQSGCQLQRMVYGYSGEGRALTAYRLGQGKNVMVLGFCIHGYEDAYPQDGKALVYTAGQVMADLLESDVISSGDWSVYILPCLNPDGLYGGYTNDGPGRCTTTCLDAEGILQAGTGVDLNRCFPARWEYCDGSRNRTGDAPLAAVEAVALSQFLCAVRGEKVNVCLDIHGWYFQTISTSLVIQSAAAVYFPENIPTYSDGGTGYLSTYAASIGYESCLLEIPSTAESYEAYIAADYGARVTGFVKTLLKSRVLFEAL